MPGNTEMTDRLFMLVFKTMLHTMDEQHPLHQKEQEKQTKQEAATAFDHGTKKNTPRDRAHRSAIFPHNV